MNKVKMVTVILAAMTMAAAASAREGSGRFFLVDQRTQIPVASCSIPRNWLAGGKTTWTTRRELPVHWYVWALSPDQKTKIIFSSQQLLPALGRLQQVPFLRDPKILANTLAAGAQRDHNVTDLRLVEARFNPRKPPQDLFNARLRQARERGIKLTGMLFTELVIRYEGRRGGMKVSIVFSLPILAVENRPGMGYNCLAEILMPMSCSCPAGAEEATKKTLQEIITSVRMNPQFIALINQITARRVAEWIRIQNEIHDKQMQTASSASKTQDKVRNMWSEYIRDVDTVTNPDTGKKMLVDSRYDHAWINKEGEVIYHNSGFNTPNASTASFDPNSNALFNRTSWQKLK
ncbi:MAG: hypothetical protein IJT50_02770 [Lentisphaeria bacterium]|nr:hypothetical protein [Lentisphaeria bacterium]